MMLRNEHSGRKSSPRRILNRRLNRHNNTWTTADDDVIPDDCGSSGCKLAGLVVVCERESRRHLLDLRVESHHLLETDL